MQNLLHPFYMIYVGISSQDLYALVFYYEMKGKNRYCIGVTTSHSGRKSFKFSKFALQFLEEKLAKLESNNNEFNKIREIYKNRNKLGGTTCAR